MSDAITTEALTRDFPGVRALDDLTLCVPRGSIFGFIGRNGAGKTTTIRLLLGLLRPTSGAARVLGYDVATQSQDVRRRCGVLLEQSGLLERLTAEQNLDVYGRIARMPRPLPGSRNSLSGSGCGIAGMSRSATGAGGCGSGWPSPARSSTGRS